MLKNLNPLLTPELLYVLAAMGHGDDLVLCDANFPAESVARTTVYGRPVRVAGADAPSAARAILSVLPLDEFVDVPASRMEVSDDPQVVPPVQQEVQPAACFQPSQRMARRVVRIPRGSGPLCDLEHFLLVRVLAKARM